MIVVDVGNTRIKWARVADRSLVDAGFAAHREAPDAALAKLAASLPHDTASVWIANVAGPVLEHALVNVVRAQLGIEPLFAAVAAEQFGVRCGYAEPTQLGVDRWLGVLAAAHAPRGLPACVVGAGTAVTFDAVDGRRRHLGGFIIGGAPLVARAFARDTAGIGATTPDTAMPKDTRTPLGHTTDEAVGYGAMLAAAAAVDRAVAAVRAELGVRPAVYLTGGDAATLRPWLETATELRADLVLEGLALLAADAKAAPRAT